MKALWPIFSLLLAIHFTSVFGQSQRRVKLSTQEKNEIGSTLNRLGVMFAMNDEERRRKLGQHKEELMDIAINLYTDGYLTLDQYKKFENEIEENKDYELCEGINIPECGSNLKEFFEKFWEENVQYKEPYCGQRLEVASAKQCCGNLKKLPFVTHQPQQCEEAAKTCTTHDDCCSKICDMDASGSSGTCAEVYSCYELKEKGQECPPESPYCKQPCQESSANITGVAGIIEDEGCETSIFCQEVNFDTSGMGECKPIAASCSGNVECCSDKCEQGKCVEKRVCTNCAKAGSKKSADRDCCPGTYANMEGVCVEDIPPFPPFSYPTSSQIEKPSKTENSMLKKALVKALRFLIPVAHARLEEHSLQELDGGGGTGRTRSDGTGSGGSGSGGTGSGNSDRTNSEGEKCSGVKDDGLTANQREEYETCVKTAMSGGGFSEQETEDVMNNCNVIKMGFLKQNEGCSGDAMSREDMKQDYNMPAILSKTYSDPAKCEFNTFNDSWKEKNYSARNAEIALRAFEVTYSGKGRDMIIAGNKALETGGYPPAYGRSIFSRAKDIAVQLRRNRKKLVDAHLKVDETMTCKCMAIFGPDKFEQDKRAFFIDKCDAGYVSDTSAPGEDGTHDSTAEEDAANQIDRGATGITHEKLLVEAIGLKRDLKFKYFQDNADLEEQMEALSDFVLNYKWIESEGTKTELDKLYSFKVRYVNGWMVALGGLAAGLLVGALIMLGPGGWAALGWAAAAGAIAGGVGGLLLDGDPANPKWHDKKVKENKKWRRVSIYRYDKIERYLDWPRFNSDLIHQAKSPDTKCDVRRQAGSCIKNAYLVNIEYGEGENKQVYENRPLLDVTLPLTVPENAYTVEKTKGSKTYVDMVNQAYRVGRRHLIDNKSGKLRHSGKHGDYFKKKHYKKNKAQGPFKDEETILAFLPERGHWQPEKFENYKEAFTEGVVNYAMCDELSECARHSDEDLNDEKDIGFAPLFEEREDAKQFAEYVYQMHLIWPRLAHEDKLTYPTLGMEAYFQAMAFNLRMAGSLALNQYRGLNELYSLYQKDWDQRVDDYEGLGGADEGETSTNVELSGNFHSAIGNLNFTNDVNVEGLKSQFDGLKGSDDFSATEIKAFGTLRSHAIRNAKAREKKAHYDKTYGKTERGKRKTAAASKFFDNFNSPLKSMDLNVGGQNLGRTGSQNSGFNNPLSALSKGDDKLNKDGKDKENNKDDQSYKDKYASTGYSSSSYGKSSAGSRSYGFGQDSSVDGESLNSDLSNSEAELMVDAAEKDRSLEEAHPGDSIWRVVSRAYKRNLSRVLVLKSEIREKDDQQPKSAPEKISSGEKDELKQLLKNDL